MRKGYLSHKRTAKAQARLRSSPEPSLFAHMTYGPRGSFRQRAKDLSLHVGLEDHKSGDFLVNWLKSVSSWEYELFHNVRARPYLFTLPSHVAFIVSCANITSCDRCVHWKDTVVGAGWCLLFWTSHGPLLRIFKCVNGCLCTNLTCIMMKTNTLPLINLGKDVLLWFNATLWGLIKWCVNSDVYLLKYYKFNYYTILEALERRLHLRRFFGIYQKHW